ncbi:MAG: site-2 protease family protein [Archaeoglobaceae archaeon]
MIDEAEFNKINTLFYIYRFEKIRNGYLFYLIPLADVESIKRFIAELSQKYDVKVGYDGGKYILELKKPKRDNLWVNFLLFIATIFTTTYVGSLFYPQPNLFGGLMFSTAIMSVLGSHEMGHYFAARRWKMKTSLPYFIPFPTIIGTMGAVIKHRGVIPNRKALFDVGVAGPIAGIFVSILVVAIGLKIPYDLSGEPGIYIGAPLLFDVIVKLVGFEGEVIHPVAFAGWVGFFVTFLNMLPVGQLDGGHVARAMFGKKAEIISKSVPPLLIVLGLYLSVYSIPTGVWIIWGLITFFFALNPHPEPLDDITPIDKRRFLLGIVAFSLAILCFTPVPFYY